MIESMVLAALRKIGHRPVSEREVAAALRFDVRIPPTEVLRAATPYWSGVDRELLVAPDFGAGFRAAIAWGAALAIVFDTVGRHHDPRVAAVAAELEHRITWRDIPADVPFEHPDLAWLRQILVKMVETSKRYDAYWAQIEREKARRKAEALALRAKLAVN